MFRIRTHRWLAFPLIALLLGLSAAPALSRMTCQISGRSVVAVGEANDCCPADEPMDVPSIKALCCYITLAKPEKSHYRSQVVDRSSCDVVDVPLLIAVVEPYDAVRPVEAIVGRPPPLTASVRLSRIGQLLL